MERAYVMLRVPAYNAADDQMDMMERLAPSACQSERAEWLKAVAAYRSRQAGAERLIDRFLSDYPHSVLRQPALLLRGSISFVAGHYPVALRRLELVDASALEPGAAETLKFRKAFCYMQMERYDEARSLFGQLVSALHYAGAARFYQGYIAYAQGDYSEALSLLKQADTSTAPGNMADYYIAQIYYMQGNYNKALSTARPLIDCQDMAPEFTAEAVRMAGESLYGLGEEAQAMPLLRRYVDSTADPQPSTRYMLGVAEYRAGQYADAIRQLGPVASEANSIGQSACLYIGQAYIREGNNAAALLALEKACSMDYDPQVTETAYYNYAVARMKGGKIPFGSSVATFEEFLRRYPGSRYAREVEEYIITGYMTDNDYARALRSIEAISRPSAKVLAAKQRVLFVMGTRSFASGDYRQALDYLTQSLKLASHNAEIASEATLWQADCYYKLGQYVKAERAYRDYLARAPRNSANRTLATYDLAYAMFAQKKYAAARTQFDKVTPESAGLKTDLRADAYNRIADTYYYVSDFGHARENYDRAYQLMPATGDYALFQKAMMRGMMRDYRGKLSELDQVIELFPASSLTASALLEKAQTYIALGDQPAAIANYRMVVERFPATLQGRNALLQLAITYRNAGNGEMALDTYREVVRKYPSSDEASVAVDDLKSIYADQGRIEELDRFLSSVAGAPRLDEAEKSSLASKSLFRRATDALEQGNGDEALALASEIVTRYPDTEVAEDALAIKADVEYSQGKTEMALADYMALQTRASGVTMLHRSRMGAARAARDLGRDETVIDMVGKILGSSAAGQSEEYEVRYMRAVAYSRTGDWAKAETEWAQLAAEPSNLYGAMSAYSLADSYYGRGETEHALEAVNHFIDADPPHQYWLARGFILLSDILRRQGNAFEADEYLRSLRNNYPGREADIFEMIDSRLKK